MTATGGTRATLTPGSLAPNDPTLCPTCKAALMFDQGAAEVAHEVTCPAGLSASWGSADEAGANPQALVHEGRAA